MIELSQIKQLEYEYFSGVMYIHLHKAQNINGINTTLIEYKCNYDVFKDKLNVYNKYKLSID